MKPQTRDAKIDADTLLMKQVRPDDWTNPKPHDKYNMVVIGAGTGGLVTASAVASLGGKVALVEKSLMGGDCLNHGCVPSKALLRCARAASGARNAHRFGIDVGAGIEVDFPAVMQRMRTLRAQISHHDSVHRFSELGVDVFRGRARFSGPNTVEVAGQQLCFARACIATGSAPAIPPVDGLDDVEYLTTNELFDLDELPRQLGIIGAGPIGVEMAQAFANFGSNVTLFESADRILPRESADAAKLVQAALKRDGVRCRCDVHITAVGHANDNSDSGSGSIRIHLKSDDTVEVDHLLVAAGRRPNVTNLGLETAGIDFHEQRGIHVDDRLRTSNRSVYGVGDVVTPYRFTHVADAMARIVVRNALFFGRQKFSQLQIPWCTYTEPEIAHVGLYARELDQRGLDYQTITQPFDEVDRAILDGNTDGFVRFHITDSSEILGATIVGHGAGDLISEISVAMHGGLKLSELSDVIHPYPTLAGAIAQASDAYNRTRLTDTVARWLKRFLKLRL